MAATNAAPGRNLGEEAAAGAEGKAAGKRERPRKKKGDAVGTKEHAAAATADPAAEALERAKAKADAERAERLNAEHEASLQARAEYLRGNQASGPIPLTSVKDYA